VSSIEERSAFLRAMRSGVTRRTSGRVAAKCGDCDRFRSERCAACDRDPALVLHPADAWTIRAVRSLSVNGSFR
jgi:hypothetical protein